ncbi:MAG: TM0106 family RecB-like putative nuclease [Myxococcales bacterium]|nr:TM0106 family RecB-like putative nuclease [Myxococcales bacterium]
MRIHRQDLQLSASDLANHLGCHHLTALNLATAHGKLSPPIWRDPVLEVLQQRGFQHEAEYLDYLRGTGLSVVEATSKGGGTPFEATIAAMRNGVDVIAQATLISGEWFGRADILRRVSVAGVTGAWSYEVVDTKLAKETRAGTVLQLCLYSDMLGEIQGIAPEFMHVVSPGKGFEPETFRVNDYLAYYRLVRARLSEAVLLDPDKEHTYPEPVPQCDICRWWSACEKRRRADDHLALVAGISRLQRKQLGEWGVETLADLAALPLPLEHKPSRGSVDSYVRVREQARVQLEARESAAPVYELLPLEPDRGLARLPEPSAGDIFFDIEGDAFVDTSGLEYLLGWVVYGEDGAADYRMLWALNAREERAAFQAFIDEVMERWAKYPDLHIYHFAPYEPGAMKRLMGRFATREDEVDRLLRAGVFVDLYSVAKQSIRAGIERYSIKDLEQFYGYEREVELKDASKSLRAFERALELGQVEAVPGDVKVAVERYNRDDCVSTLRLRDWLEQLRESLVASGEDIQRPELASDGAPKESLDERQQRLRALMERLLENIGFERDERSDEDQAAWLLAHMLDWHRREEKAPWWEYFRLSELGPEDLLDENAGLAGLVFVGREGGTDKCPIHRYRFPAQDSLIEEDDPLFRPGGEQLGKVEAVDATERFVDIKKRSDSADLHPEAVFAHSVVTAPEQAKALFRLGEWVADHGIDADGPHRAARDLLLSRAPRLRGSVPSRQPLEFDGETTADAARRMALQLDGGVLAIQGPPGAGKTYTGARMICDLVKAGKKVGITAVSHKVIRNLLDAVVEAADEQDLLIRCLQKVSGKAATFSGGAIRETTKNKSVVAALQAGSMDVVAGTPWLWAREDLFESVDVLFVDEAGQMSLANVVSIAQAAENVILLGDPQQLDQPLQGSHPEGTEASALEHLLAGHQTIPRHRGLFLAETWRLHPDICALTSELFYESRLQPRPDLGNQRIVGETPFAGAGLWFVPVEHDGNQNSSQEEVEVVADLVKQLLTEGLTWVDREGAEAPISQDDILIVAPYNAQVGALGERLPGARIGTVDKFQGQEAPVVIYSMATSSPDEAPRGMEFLFSLNRLNVATSRARCACILVASSRLFEPECRTPRQIQLANAFCRYLELAKTL